MRFSLLFRAFFLCSPFPFAYPSFSAFLSAHRFSLRVSTPPPAHFAQTHASFGGTLFDTHPSNFDRFVYSSVRHPNPKRLRLVCRCESIRLFGCTPRRNASISCDIELFYLLAYIWQRRVNNSVAPVVLFAPSGCTSSWSFEKRPRVMRWWMYLLDESKGPSATTTTTTSEKPMLYVAKWQRARETRSHRSQFRLQSTQRWAQNRPVNTKTANKLSCTHAKRLALNDYCDDG